MPITPLSPVSIFPGAIEPHSQTGMNALSPAAKTNLTPKQHRDLIRPRDRPSGALGLFYKSLKANKGQLTQETAFQNDPGVRAQKFTDLEGRLEGLTAESTPKDKEAALSDIKSILKDMIIAAGQKEGPGVPDENELRGTIDPLAKKLAAKIGDGVFTKDGEALRILQRLIHPQSMHHTKFGTFHGVKDHTNVVGHEARAEILGSLFAGWENLSPKQKLHVTNMAVEQFDKSLINDGDTKDALLRTLAEKALPEAYRSGLPGEAQLRRGMKMNPMDIMIQLDKHSCSIGNVDLFREALNTGFEKIHQLHAERKIFWDYVGHQTFNAVAAAVRQITHNIDVPPLYVEALNSVEPPLYVEAATPSTEPPSYDEAATPSTELPLSAAAAAPAVNT